MPNAVLVALASASFTAASGAALTHIRSHRNPSAARLNGIMEFHAISHFADEKQMK